MKVAYIRVSTVEQNEARQLEAMKTKGIEKYYTEGDTIYVHDFSRLARSTKDLLDIIEYLKGKGVTLISNKESIDTSTPQGKLMVTMLGAIYEFERANLLERQREGIAEAVKNGKYKGGQVKKIDNKTFDKYYAQYQSRQINKVQFAKALNISRPTLDKLLKEKCQQEVIK